MLNRGTAPTILNCVFDNNSADYGGGMYNESCNATLTDCTFTSNTAFLSGGGMRNRAVHD